MTQKSLLQPLRGELVRAAETVLDKQGGLPRNPENSQLARLVQVAGEAVCVDEIANYLRYQGARGRWKRSLAEDVIEAVRSLIGPLDSEPERVAAWRLYATYLRRAYYYRREVNRDLERTRRKDGPPQRAAQPAAHPPREEAPGEPGAKRRRPRRRRRGAGPGEAAAGADAAAEAAGGAEGQAHEAEHAHEDARGHEIEHEHEHEAAHDGAAAPAPWSDAAPAADSVFDASDRAENTPPDPGPAHDPSSNGESEQ